jgi:hypothetical protein
LWRQPDALIHFEREELLQNSPHDTWALPATLPMAAVHASRMKSGSDLQEKNVFPSVARFLVFIFLLSLCHTPSAAQSSPESGVASAVSDRDRLLLEKIDRLERRIAELEARAGIESTRQSDPPVATATQAIQETSRPLAEMPATNSSASSTEAEAPFAFADFTWLNGNSRTKESPLDSKVFTGEFRADVSYIYDLNHPQDHTLSGTSESGRTGEFQVQQLGVGGDFHYNNARGRVMTQFGMYSTMTPRNDASPGRGQWNLADAYRYLSEAYGGYHLNVLHGINIDAGIFMSYVGLFSYYNFDNWAYQPSYVSSNTPWFFNGLRIQIFPTAKLKIEPWLVNGWQSYGVFNGRPGGGLQVLWRPNGAVSILSNSYLVGQDTLGAPHRTRYHSDDSIEVKYYDNPAKFADKAAFSLTVDAGCESGSGVSCFGDSKQGPKQAFLGAMLYNRVWFHKDLYAVTLGGGAITNPGRYLVLLPPINGATAFSGTPYFTLNPGDQFKAWDTSSTFDYMPSQFVTFRFEYDHRAANVPYFSGGGGITPPGGNLGAPGSLVPSFFPDLRKRENRFNLALLVKL